MSSPHLAGAPSRQHTTSASSSLSSAKPSMAPNVLVSVRLEKDTNLLASMWVRPPSSQTSSHPWSTLGRTEVSVPIRPEIGPSNLSSGHTGREYETWYASVIVDFELL